ncbi:acetate CoA-transferase subunit beta [Escherichia coli]|uniref:Acetate CoA-transferase subunit beta n=1 Tax=Escherichia coli TaxID=562 RepID=A0A377K3C9_ECOLX|nr:acetate CoA-transferase subunit beta [Escherichia coli]
MFDSAMSFALIRGGHIDACVLGGLPSRRRSKPRELGSAWENGCPVWVARWNLVTGSRKVIIAMEHCAKDGQQKFWRRCTMPLTAQHAVHMLVTGTGCLSFY